MSGTNGSFQARLGGRNGRGVQHDEKNQHPVERPQAESATSSSIEAMQATEPAPASTAGSNTKSTGRKPKGKKWAKVNLFEIAPMAGPALVLPENNKGKPKWGPRENERPHRGVNLDGESLSDIADRMARLELEKKTKPLEEFPIFSELAPEMRAKIWNFAAHNESKILELVLHDDFFQRPDPEDHEAIDMTIYNHDMFYVSKQGQVVPSMMQANREARGEGSRVFEKRYINFYPPGYEFSATNVRPWTWFNPQRDIIFFGEDTCINTVVQFFRRNAEKSWPRVAFRSSNIHGTCKRQCNFDSSDIMSGRDDPYMCYLGHAIGGGGVGILGVLHGKPEEIALNHLLPGAPSVKEVFFVVKSEAMKFEAGAMTNNLTFRPAVHNGLTYGQERTKFALEREVDNVRSGAGIPSCGVNRWDCGNYPDFNFVSLAPPLNDGRGKELVHDAVMVPTRDMGKLTYRNGQFLHDLAHKAGVNIVPAEKAYTGEKNREICLYNGTEEGISKAKEEIQKQVLLDFEVIRRGPLFKIDGPNRGGGRGKSDREGFEERGGRGSRGGRGRRGR